MKTIENQLSEIQQNKKIGLMTHVVIGFPTLKATLKLVQDMATAGVDFVELQIPFSDPLADGPTIMQANDVALAQGVTLEDCFDVMKKLSSNVNIPLLFMAYYQSVFHLGVDNFCRKAKEAGAEGLIIPDIPIDEEKHEHFIRMCKKYHLHHIRLLSPTSSEERMKLNAKVQNGFVYCTSLTGTTGSKYEMNASSKKYLEIIRKYFHVPIAVGFGISVPEQIADLVGYADIAVVGSAIINVIQKEGTQAVSKYITRLLSQL